MNKSVAVLAGDGIGPEVVREAIRVLEAVTERSELSLSFNEALVGGAAFDEHGEHFPDETKKVCESSDAILFGSVGGPVGAANEPKWKGCEANSILALRKTFQFSSNLRPATVIPELSGISPLKPELLAEGVDILIVRELVGDIYFGAHETVKIEGRRVARDVAEYTEDQIASVARAAFIAARDRNKLVSSVDKANVLDTSRLWRAVVSEVHQEFSEVELEHCLVDSCAMDLVQRPAHFDVIVTSNLFGDILSDIAAVLPGSLGLTPSASLNSEGFGLYEPSGGSAPDIAGKGIANPIAQILSSAMMLRFSFGCEKEAKLIESAVQEALSAGYRTGDISSDENSIVSTIEMTDAILKHLD